jgi:hypothetical protein
MREKPRQQPAVSRPHDVDPMIDQQSLEVRQVMAEVLAPTHEPAVEGLEGDPSLAEQPLGDRDRAHGVVQQDSVESGRAP